ncbi:MAG TPA: P-II family nitrogen regulator [Atribacterota bacterium]|nr:P-II family nitrogen regulator [Atribacterota bacterium]HOR42606.1 P-II family nitrogen regulator [Atribacterota bacterium]
METLKSDNIQILTLILTEEQSHKCIQLAKEKGLCDGLINIGRGTVKSTVLNLLGIKDVKKEIISFLIDGDKAKEMMDYFEGGLQLTRPGHGIAYTRSVRKIVGFSEQEAEQKEGITSTILPVSGKDLFQKLNIIVERGMADRVMKIAYQAGVKGGTILHGKSIGAVVDTALFGVEIVPEQELVIILTPNDLVEKVIFELSRSLFSGEQVKGIIFTEPILDIRGLMEVIEQK